MPRPSRFKSEGLQHLFDRFVGEDPDQVAAYEKALSNARAAQAIYALRTEAGLSQVELAKRVGTTASVISRLEDADYEGHTLSMHSRIAAALGRRLELSFPAIESEVSGSVSASAKPDRRHTPATARKATRVETSSPKRSPRKPSRT